MSAQQNAYTQELIDTVLRSLNRVPTEVTKMILGLAKNNITETIINFNQCANDLFCMLKMIIKKYKLADPGFKIDGYQHLFNNAIKANNRLPIDKFTLTILVYAADIYDENEDVFLSMDIPETAIKVGNEFEIFSSDVFKRMWKIIDPEDKENLKQIVSDLTACSHAYFYHMVMTAAGNK